MEGLDFNLLMKLADDLTTGNLVFDD